MQLKKREILTYGAIGILAVNGILNNFTKSLSDDLYSSIRERFSRSKEAINMASDNSDRIDVLQKDFATFQQVFMEYKKAKTRTDSAQWESIRTINNRIFEIR